MIGRAPTWDDLGTVAALVEAADRNDIGEPDWSAEDIRERWRMPGFDLARDAWLVELDGRVAGFGMAWEPRGGDLVAAGSVHPAARGCGVGADLVRRAEGRARERGAEKLAYFVLGHDSAARRLLGARGFGLARHFFRMTADVVAPPADPVWPPGFAGRAFVPGQDERAVYNAVNEAFDEGWGRTPEPYERWRARHVEDESFDPALWLLALDGREIAGFALCGLYPTGGIVGVLGVRRPWRRRGLGRALLLHAFGEFHRRGARQVALGVDAANPTGATRLYERAGMRVAYRYDRYEKELR